MPITETTLRFWGPAFADRRGGKRRKAGFFAVAIDGDARYLRKICDLSDTGFLLEDKLNEHRPGDVVELDMPRPDGDPVRVRAEVVRVTDTGKVALRTVDGPPLDRLGGAIAL